MVAKGNASFFKTVALFVAVVLQTLTAIADIPQSERDALIALYEATNGAEWLNRTNWRNAGDTEFNDPGTECTWFGVGCKADGTTVVSVSLDGNQLSGPMPPELSDLVNLQIIDLSVNQLTGSLPAQITNLTSLTFLGLDYNRLDGLIPPEIGDLISLSYLGLSSNQLVGAVPGELANLTNLCEGSPEAPCWGWWGLNLGYNALYSDDAALVAFIDSKHLYSPWQSTQTVPPEGIAVTATGDCTIWLEWLPLTQGVAAGAFEVLSVDVPAGSAVSGGMTSNKFETTFPVTGLQPGQTYDLYVRTIADAHSANQNRLVSVLSAPVTATTSDLGCSEPQVQVSGCDPATLTVVSSHDSVEWSSGETTSSISVQSGSWSWVKTTGPGSCQEATVVQAASCIFKDGFDSGDAAAWSVMVP
jgi:hypothetical protein